MPKNPLVPPLTSPAKARTILVLTSRFRRFPDVFVDHATTPTQCMLNGISAAAIKHRISAPVQFVDKETALRLADRATWPLALQQGQIDGLIISSVFAEQIIESLGNKLPLVLIPSIEKSLNIDSIGPEHLHGIENLVRHLHQLGHRRIGFLSTAERATWAHERFTGYVYGLNKLDLPFQSDDVINLYGPRLDNIQLVARALERTHAGVTAWVCVSDGLAAQVYHGFKQAGLQVPRDVSITGFDGVEVFKDCPQLTTIAVPWAAMGAAALLSLVHRIDHPGQEPAHRAYVGQLVTGETAAPPPSGQ
jgi:LacI family transcriptional regulator